MVVPVSDIDIEISGFIVSNDSIDGDSIFAVIDSCLGLIGIMTILVVSGENSISSTGFVLNVSSFSAGFDFSVIARLVESKRVGCSSFKRSIIVSWCDVSDVVVVSIFSDFVITFDGGLTISLYAANPIIIHSIINAIVFIYFCIYLLCLFIISINLSCNFDGDNPYKSSKISRLPCSMNESVKPSDTKFEIRNSKFEIL